MKNEKFINSLPLETDRLTIRPTALSDIDMILKMDKQEVTQKYLGGIKTQTREERIAFLENKTSKFQSKLVGSLTVVLKEKNIPIGFIDISIDDNNNNAQISYLYDYEYTKKGYCSEALKKLLDVAFKELELKKVYADTIEGNISSIKVLEKLGFKREGTRRKQAYIKEENQYCDFLDYGLLIDEYK